MGKHWTLAASPDRLIDNDGIIEIKYPTNIKDYTPEEAVSNKKIKFMKIDNGNLILIYLIYSNNIHIISQ